jgi:hypothetical protein
MNDKGNTGKPELTGGIYRKVLIGDMAKKYSQKLNKVYDDLKLEKVLQKKDRIEDIQSTKDNAKEKVAATMSSFFQKAGFPLDIIYDPNTQSFEMQPSDDIKAKVEKYSGIEVSAETLAAQNARNTLWVEAQEDLFFNTTWEAVADYSAGTIRKTDTPIEEKLTELTAGVMDALSEISAAIDKDIDELAEAGQKSPHLKREMHKTTKGIMVGTAVVMSLLTAAAVATFATVGVAATTGLLVPLGGPFAAVPIMALGIIAIGALLTFGAMIVIDEIAPQKVTCSLELNKEKATELIKATESSIKVMEKEANSSYIGR